MKNSILLGSLFIAILLSSCNQQEQKPVASPLKSNKLELKHGPSDEFFLQRIGPDGRFALDAYEKGLAEAQVHAKTRSGISGFDQEWVTQGPGNIGARINTIAVNPTDEDEIYAGFAGGGLWKTSNGGTDWAPIFDAQRYQNIGDIVVDQNNPQTIFVGTGDPNISGYPKIGDGIYKSTNGGDDWEHIGLTDQRIISKIILDPSDSQTIYAGTMGLPFERNNDRGLYKTIDGGVNWDQILFISDSTGIIDMVMDPTNSSVLYASSWDRIRNNVENFVDGENAQIWKTTDGGANWSILTNGLPTDEPQSRIGLTIYPQNPSILYASVVGTDLQLESIYKTIDAGMTWDTIPTDQDLTGLSSNALGGFGWYFGAIRVNPMDEDEIFLLGVDLWRTTDGGNTWGLASPPWWEYSVHADKHDMIFLPSGDALLATDGGLYKFSQAAGEWLDIENIPTTQFYRVTYNPHDPDNYYGGAQDNGSTGGNAADINDWTRIYGGDGFEMQFDPTNPDRFFAETQRGGIVVFNGYYIDDGTDGIDPEDRRNWDMPYKISASDPTQLYAGTFRIYQGTGDIPFWFPISEDLTDGTEDDHRYHNITALDDSPIENNLLYAGTGDGNVWKMDDFIWEKISNDLPDQYVTDVVASPHDSDWCYVSYSGYRDNDDLPRIHKSTDRGTNWDDISGDLPDLAINDILIIPEYEDEVLFVATDGGVYGTTNSGASWKRVGSNMPTVTVYELDFNPVKNEIIGGTFARSIMSYNLDSLLGALDTTFTSTAYPLVLAENALKIYPNPATDIINIDVQNIEPNRNYELVILDARGKVVDQFTKSISEIETIDISQYPFGNYFVKLKMRHDIRSGQFVKVQ